MCVWHLGVTGVLLNWFWRSTVPHQAVPPTSFMTAWCLHAPHDDAVGERKARQRLRHLRLQVTEIELVGSKGCPMDYPTLPISFHWAPLGWSRYIGWDVKPQLLCGKTHENAGIKHAFLSNMRHPWPENLVVEGALGPPPVFCDADEGPTGSQPDCTGPPFR